VLMKGSLIKKTFTKLRNDFSSSHKFLASRTPQQKGVVERKNCTLKDMARRKLCKSNLPTSFG